MSRIRHITIGNEDSGVRIDRWLQRTFPDLGFGYFAKLLRTGQIRVDGHRCKVGMRLDSGQVIRLPPMPDAQPGSVTTRTASRSDVAWLQSRVIYKDEAVLVIDKPAGLAVQGGSGISQNVDSMLDGLRFGNTERPRLVHRLDRLTSGILVLARTLPSARAIQEAFRRRTVEKLYWAVVAGLPDAGTIKLPLTKLPGRGGERVRVDPNHGRHAVTDLQIVEAAGKVASWVELVPMTGRTHQLRVHCSAIGHPILGDDKYGADQSGLRVHGLASRLHLHAQKLSLPHPYGGVLVVSTGLPEDLGPSWHALGFSPPKSGSAGIRT